VVEPGDPAEHAVIDSGGQLRTGYGAADDTLVLVRPDGYVRLVAGTAEQVGEYWTALLPVTAGAH
jgi:hypothetical protein